MTCNSFPPVNPLTHYKHKICAFFLQTVPFCSNTLEISSHLPAPLRFFGVHCASNPHEHLQLCVLSNAWKLFVAAPLTHPNTPRWTWKLTILQGSPKDNSSMFHPYHWCLDTSSVFYFEVVWNVRGAWNIPINSISSIILLTLNCF